MRGSAILAGLMLAAAGGMLCQPGVSAQPAPPPPPKPICALRLSVLESFPAFAPALPQARAALVHTALSAQAQADYARFDTALAGTIAATAPGSDATLALVDLERLIDTLDTCGQKLGWGAVMQQSRPALYAALSRNRKTLTDPVYAQRLLRSATAQAVLRDNGQGNVVVAAVDIAARQKEEQAAIARAEAAERARLAAERRQLEDAARLAWSNNPGAATASALLCNTSGAAAYAGRPKDTAWLALMDNEAQAGCKRLDDRKDGSYYLGVPMGGEVTDEQLAHAAGKVFLCFSNSRARQAWNAAVSAGRAVGQPLGEGALALGLNPTWNEGANAAGRRVVTIGCDPTFSMLGLDMTGMTRDFMNATGIDRRSFIQFELSGNRLRSVRLRKWIDNTESSRTETDWIYGGSSTTTICDAARASAAAIGSDWTRDSWAISQRLPYRFANPNGAQRSDQWMVLRRGTLSADIWNVTYNAPVLGENGNCFGGIVEHFVTLTAERPSRIKAGVPPAF